MWLALGMAACFVLTTAAAPITPSGPESKGPISDVLRMRGKLPATTPPAGMKVVLVDDILEVERWVTQYVTEARERTVVVDGKEVTEKYAVSKAVPVVTKSKVTAKDCKFFVVAKEGKLEAIDLKKAAERLKKPTAVLTGDSAEVDPRNLEVVKPGTLYVITPLPAGKGLVEPIPDKRSMD
jgi:hypothetical protein